MRYRVLDIVLSPCCHAELGAEPHVLDSGRPTPTLEAVPCRVRCARHEMAPAERAASDCVQCYGEEIKSGSLVCETCGSVYPITEFVPELVAASESPDSAAGAGAASASADPRRHDVLQSRTRRSFGYQWTEFSEMTEEFRQNFLEYVAPLEPGFFDGKVGLDAGCGFGRHIYWASRFGAEMVGMDFSDAVFSSRRNTESLPMVHVIRGDIYDPPLRPGNFDFVYSIGVLHHLPDPEGGYRSIVRFAKPGGTAFIWVYSTRRRILNAIIEGVRGVTTHLPLGLLKVLSFSAAAAEWMLAIGPARLANRTALGRRAVDAVAPARVRLYARYPFQVSAADWFDRLSAPTRNYYDDADLHGWADRAGLQGAETSPTGMYGWRLRGSTAKGAGA